MRWTAVLLTTIVGCGSTPGDGSGATDDGTSEASTGSGSEASTGSDSSTGGSDGAETSSTSESTGETSGDTGSDGGGEVLEPRGIFSLGSAQDQPGSPDDERVGHVRDYDFLSGATLRLFWRDLNPEPEVFDFEVVNEALALLEANVHARRLNLEVFPTEVPDWVIAQSTDGWEHFVGGAQPLPWDPQAQSAWNALLHALAEHPVLDGESGATVAFSDHPLLVAVDAQVVGIGGVRDNLGMDAPPKLVTHPEYTRERFVGAVLDSIAIARAAFPDKLGYVAYFAMTDEQPGSLDETLLDALAAEYNGDDQPVLGVFQELLSDIAPAPESNLGENLTRAHEAGAPVMFQALTSWLHPFTGSPEATASKNPATGIQRGFDGWQARYYELYVADLDDAAEGALDAEGRPIADDLRTWNAMLQ